MFSTEQQEKLIGAVLKRKENALCADCNTKSPCWASLDFGVFVCMNCSGAHRALGPAVTRVKSTKLDSWHRDWFENMQIGNSVLNEYWEQRGATGYAKKYEASRINRFVQDKYVRRKFADPKQQYHPLERLKKGLSIESKPLQAPKKQEPIAKLEPVKKPRRKSSDNLMVFEEAKPVAPPLPPLSTSGKKAPPVQEDNLMSFDSNHTEGYHSVSSGAVHHNNFMDLKAATQAPTHLHTTHSTPHYPHHSHSASSLPAYNTGMNVHMNMYPNVMNIHMNSPQHHHHYHYPQQPQQPHFAPQTPTQPTQSHQSYGAGQLLGQHSVSNSSNSPNKQGGITLEATFDWNKTKSEDVQKQPTSWTDDWK